MKFSYNILALSSFKATIYERTILFCNNSIFLSFMYFIRMILAKAPLRIDTVKDRKETFALCEVFHELSAVTSRLERERVRTVSIARGSLTLGVNNN